MSRQDQEVQRWRDARRAEMQARAMGRLLYQDWRRIAFVFLVGFRDIFGHLGSTCSTIREKLRHEGKFTLPLVINYNTARSRNVMGSCRNFNRMSPRHIQVISL